jgi:dinuclear metal center YbgI/SA1388 family protein
MESLAPRSLAEEWDNVGLQVGNPAHRVKNIWIALDPTYAVVKAACRKKVDLLITHHPLLFKPLQSLNFSTPLGSIIDLAVQHQLAIFAAHTNLDSTLNGINDVLADRIGVYGLKPLVNPNETTGIGRIGSLETALDLKSLAQMIKKKMNLQHLRFAGDPALSVKKVAICSGSGASLLANFFESGAQAFISGDLRYHDARDVESSNLGLVDIGHFPSEHLIVQVLADRLRSLLAESQMNVDVDACDLEKDPFKIL